MTVSSWVPSATEFADAYGLPAKTKVNQRPLVNFWVGGRTYDGEYDDASVANLNGTPPTKLWIRPGLDYHFLDWGKPSHAALLPDEYARRTMQELYSKGIFFLYGMLHRYLFDHAPKLLSSVEIYPSSQSGQKSDATSSNGGRLGGEGKNSDDSESPYTIAVHSRHSSPSNKGCDVHLEMNCLKGLLLGDDHDERTTPQRQQHHLLLNRTCEVYLLSDRTVRFTVFCSPAISHACSFQIPIVAANRSCLTGTFMCFCH